MPCLLHFPYPHSQDDAFVQAECNCIRVLYSRYDATVVNYDAAAAAAADDDDHDDCQLSHLVHPAD